MIHLDHLILPVTNPSRSVKFYTKIIGLTHLGRAGPFEVIRVNSSLNIDLMTDASPRQMHLAFAVDRITFDSMRARLAGQDIAIGSDTFTRDGYTAPNPFGAGGMADSFYFYDPDNHNLELRCYDNDSG
jgi:catechol 2,3-dioxygenase-like lactoylglutathione lyase family enzyme